MKNKKLGFTLVEIIIVVSIVIVAISIAVPNFLRSRVFAYDTAAIANCRTITNACQLYLVNNEEFPTALSSLVEPTSNPPYIDPMLASGTKQGYQFVFNRVDEGHYTLNANPTSTGLLKGRYFYTDESSIIRVNSDSPAGPDDEIVY